MSTETLIFSLVRGVAIGMIIVCLPGLIKDARLKYSWYKYDKEQDRLKEDERLHPEKYPPSGHNIVYGAPVIFNKPLYEFDKDSKRWVEK